MGANTFDGDCDKMTPISEMTNDELDRYIAELRNPEIECPKCGEYHRWNDVDVDSIPLMDFVYSPTTDPRYAMELLEEMLASGNIVKLSNGDGDSRDLDMAIVEKILRIVNVWHDIHVSTGDTKRTISKAYAQWKGKK